MPDQLGDLRELASLLIARSIIQWIERSIGRGLRPSGNVSKLPPPPAVANGGAPGIERSITCSVIVWRAGASIGAVATRSVVSGGDPPVGSEAGVEGDGDESSGAAARGLSVRPLRSVGGGEAVAPGGKLAFGERLCGGEPVGSEVSLARLARIPSGREAFVGPPERAVTTEGASVRAGSGSVNTGRLSGLGGPTLTGTVVKNTGHFVGTNDGTRTTLAAREPVIITVRTRRRRLPR